MPTAYWPGAAYRLKRPVSCGCFRSEVRTICALLHFQNPNPFFDNGLRIGGGGNRTPVPRQLQRCLYVHSRSFVLATPSAHRQAFVAASPTVFSPRRGQASNRGQPTSGVTRNSGRLPRDGLPVFRQPWRNCCHLSFFARCFTRPPDHLGTPHPSLLARSSPFAPYVELRMAKIEWQSLRLRLSLYSSAGRNANQPSVFKPNVHNKRMTQNQVRLEKSRFLFVV